MTEQRVFQPIPRKTIVMPPVPTHGPVVTPADWADGDRSMARYFWTSTGKDEHAFEVDESEIRRIIRFGMKARPVVHGTPFGHGEMTIHVDRVPMPIAVQMIRHRVLKVSDGDGPAVALDWLPNISAKSYRYVKLTGGTRMVENGRQPSHSERARELFYVPRPEDLYGEEGRPGSYTRVPLPDDVREGEVERFERVYAMCLREYEEALESGVAAESARFLLPQGAYTRLYATESYRNWFNFCLARNDIHAQQEVRWIGQQVEGILAQAAPIAYETWVEYGRRML